MIKICQVPPIIAPARIGLNSYVDLNNLANNSPPQTPIGPITTINKGIVIKALKNGTKILLKALGNTFLNIFSSLAIKKAVNIAGSTELP